MNFVFVLCSQLYKQKFQKTEFHFCKTFSPQEPKCLEPTTIELEWYEDKTRTF